MRKTVGLLTAGLVLAGGAGIAHASSEDSWKAFRADLADACREKVPEGFTVEHMRVDPFGSESYGVAVVQGSSKPDDEAQTLVCVYDKRDKTAEMSGPVTEEVSFAPATKETREGSCSADCADTEKLVGETDRAELAGIEGQVRRTLAELESKNLPSNDQAKAVAAAFAAGGERFDPSKVAPGDYRCTVYWYGFLENGAQRVGAHKCRVGSENGAIAIEKLTGEGLRAKLMPWRNSSTAYLGRTYIEDQPERGYDPDRPDNTGNANFGNKVGLVVGDASTFYLVSIDDRGMQPKDTTFFEAIEMSPVR